MKLTPDERRMRIYAKAMENQQCREFAREYEKAKALCQEYANTMPQEIHDVILGYPVMGYFLHHRLLDIICENMRFPDEDE